MNSEINDLIKIFEENSRLLDIFDTKCIETPENLNLIFDSEFNIQTIYEQLDEILIQLKNFGNPYEYFGISPNKKSALSSQQLTLINKFEQKIRKSLDTKEFFSFPLWEIIYLKMMVLLYYCISYYEFDYSEENVNIILSKTSKGSSQYYRGHSNYNFQLVPSLYRNLDFDKVIDKKIIRKLYEEAGLLEKYRVTINPKVRLGYTTCAFLQHSASYSPFLDFTESKDIALVFATQPSGGINLYKENDAALILLSLKSKGTTPINIGKINIQYYSSKLNWNSYIYGRPLYKCSLKDFDLQISFSKKVTNDRMIYQHGVFLCLNKCTIVRGTPLFPFSFGYFVKFKIKSEKHSSSFINSKKSIYNQIISTKNHLQENYLMNPYLIFSQYAKKV